MWHDTGKKMTSDDFTSIIKNHFSPKKGSEQFIETLKEMGFAVQLISGAPTDYCILADRFYNFDFVAESNRMIFIDNIFSNLVPGPHYFDKKAIAMDNMRNKLSISTENTIAVGDSYNDIEMLGKAGSGFIIDSQEDILKTIHKKGYNEKIIPINSFDEIISHIENKSQNS